MREVELCVPEGDVGAAIEAVALEAGLGLSSKGTLRAYAGSVHWHFRRAGSGTLEATWHPASGRLWLKVASNRDAQWIEEAIEAFVKALGRKKGAGSFPPQ